MAGYFVGTFFGEKDSWKKSKKNMIFLSKTNLLQLFNKFEILYFNEIEKDGTTKMGENKHWHIFVIIAKKRIGCAEGGDDS